MEVAVQADVIKELARMQEMTARFIIQMLTWKIVTEEDDEAVYRDIHKLQNQMNHIKWKAGM